MHQKLHFILFIHRMEKKGIYFRQYSLLKILVNVVDQRFHEHKELFEAQWELYVYQMV